MAIIKIYRLSPTLLSESENNLALYKDQMKRLHTNDVATKNESLKPMQMDDHVQISPSTSPLSQANGKLTHDNKHTESKNAIPKLMQSDSHSQNSLYTSPLSPYEVTFTYENEMMNILHVDDVAADNKMFKSMQTDGHCHISPSTSPLSRSTITLTNDNDRTNSVHVSGATNENKMLELKKTDGRSQISSPISPYRSALTLTHDNNKAKIFDVNFAASTDPSSRLDGKFTYDNDQAKVISKAELSELVKTDGHSYISTFTSSLSNHEVTLDYENDMTKIIHMNDTSVENEILKPIQNNGHGQILHVNGAPTKNEMLDKVQTNDHSQICSSTSPLFRSPVTLSHG